MGKSVVLMGPTKWRVSNVVVTVFSRNFGLVVQSSSRGRIGGKWK